MAADAAKGLNSTDCRLDGDGLIKAYGSVDLSEPQSSENEQDVYETTQTIFADGRGKLRLLAVITDTCLLAIFV